MFEVSGSYLNLIFQQNSSDNTLVGGRSAHTYPLLPARWKWKTCLSCATSWRNGFLLLLGGGVSVGSWFLRTPCQLVECSWGRDMLSLLLEEMEKFPSAHLAFSDITWQRVWDTCTTWCGRSLEACPLDLHWKGWDGDALPVKFGWHRYLLSKSFWFLSAAPCLSVGMESSLSPGLVCHRSPIGVPGGLTALLRHPVWTHKGWWTLSLLMPCCSGPTVPDFFYHLSSFSSYFL